VRDTNDSDEKFERRFAEYEVETLPVEEAYRKRGILFDVGITLREHSSYGRPQIDANGTKEENVAEMTRKLDESEIWGKSRRGGTYGCPISPWIVHTW
jgi:adenylate kinase family enzyme